MVASKNAIDPGISASSPHVNATDTASANVQTTITMIALTTRQALRPKSCKRLAIATMPSQKNSA